MSKLYVYDFDDTLVNTHKVLEQQGWMEHAKNGILCNEQNELGFKVADLSKPYGEMWSRVVKSYKLGTNMILSGRCEAQISHWLIKNQLNDWFDVLVGLASRDNVPEKKAKILREYASKYDEVYFYDDKIENISLAKSIPGVIAIHVEH